MIADEMVKLLIREFWCFETYTEHGQEYADKMAVKNAIKHCHLIINSDPLNEYVSKPAYQNGFAVDGDFWNDVVARLEMLWEKIKNN